MIAEPDKLRELFFAALKVPIPQRAAYLLSECAGADALREQVELLLAAHEELGTIAPAPTIDQPVSERLGTMIGPYKLLQLIGEGGMGTVYMAEQTHPIQRKVALKIIKAGMDSAQVIARFEAERQALAMMDHVNIARVIDGGTIPLRIADFGLQIEATGDCAPGSSNSQSAICNPQLGRPYFVMELVHGVPITKYCDDNHLTPRERLELFVPVCQAIQHAHQKGIIHRDIKPSNVMVTLYDGKPVPKVIDFGVAKATEQKLTERTLFTQYGTMIGTLEYMSPEQAEMSALGVDTRSDIYSLGVLLYELLTGSTPLTHKRMKEAAYTEILRMIKEEEPPKPSTRLSENRSAELGTRNEKAVSRSEFRAPRWYELDWIVMKCLEKDRNRRYETANSFAADVQRYLADEPVLACPPSAGYRLKKFMRRNKKTATVAVTAVLAFLGLIAALIFYLDAKAANAKLDEGVAQAKADALQRELLLLEMQAHRTHLPAPVMGWSENALDLARQTARIRVSDNLRNQAVASLAGLDAHSLKQMGHGASALAWDRNGKRLLMGASRHGKASLLEVGREGETPFDYDGQGPVAFRDDGTAVQLVANPKNRWEVGLWDMAKAQQIQAFQIPPGGKAETPTKLYPVLLAMTGDGAVLAAVTSEVDEKGNLSNGHLAAWKAGTDKALVKAEAKVTALTLSPDGTLLAAGDENGWIRFWSLSDGKELEPLKGERAEVHALAFGRNPHRPEAGSDGGLSSPWLLASGASGGTVTIWDLLTRQVKCRCLGSDWDVNTVAFSPDGMTLASAGHGAGRLWDVATGRLLLSGMVPGYATSAAFSPDGHRLAFSSDHPVPGNGNVRVYELERGRGMQTLRGLVGQIAHVCFSPDGRRLAALSMNWQVALWDTEKNRLLHVLDVPPGLFADNAGLCFSPDGNRFAFVTGKQAKMWEVTTGRELGSWELNWGLVEMLAFRSNDELVSFRMETSSGLPPVGEVSWKEHPRICHIRHLTLPKQMKLVAKIEEFNERVFTAAITPDGSYVVVEGPGPSKGDPHKIRIYDGTSGKEVGSLPTSNTAEHVSRLTLDPAGKILAYQPTEPGQATLVDMPSGTERAVLPYGLWSLSPGANYWVSGVTLIRGQDGTRLFTIGIDGGVSCFSFGADGNHIAWGHTDGSVTVCDIPEVQRRLAKIAPGLGW